MDGKGRTKRNDGKLSDVEEGGAYIDDSPVDMRMNHNEDSGYIVSYELHIEPFRFWFMSSDVCIVC
jgi:hypothetical protein